MWVNEGNASQQEWSEEWANERPRTRGGEPENITWTQGEKDVKPHEGQDTGIKTTDHREWCTKCVCM